MYVKIGLNLSQFQKEKIKQAFQTKLGLHSHLITTSYKDQTFLV